MSLNLLNTKGVPLDRQKFTWKEFSRTLANKLDDDAFTRVRVILMNGIESEALRFLHVMSRSNGHLRLPAALVRKLEQHQQTMVNWLLPPDLSPLETTIAYEQVAIEVTAAISKKEPDPYIKQIYRFGLLEDFDHLYRYSALLDRLEGKDANCILQSYTDVLPGRPTIVEHRAPEDDVRDHYDRKTASPLTKLHALTLVGGEYQTHDYYMTVGPIFADPLARQLYAEIASVEEQHVTQYESILDPTETPLEQWLLHEANEVYNYYSCVESETNSAVKKIWERFLDYELGHLNYVCELFKKHEKRDPAEILPSTVPEPIAYQSHREYVIKVLKSEKDLRARATDFIPANEESTETLAYRNHLNQEGSPSQTVAANYKWNPGTELSTPETSQAAS
jgi:hypothetical protein